jgi:hypothetical protein
MNRLGQEAQQALAAATPDKLKWRETIAQECERLT